MANVEDPDFALQYLKVNMVGMRFATVKKYTNVATGPVDVRDRPAATGEGTQTRYGLKETLIPTMPTDR